MQNPYILKGEVTDNNLASVLINDQAVGVLPISNNQYAFEIGVPLTRDQNKTLTIEARDNAGNKTTTECILKLNAALDVEIIAPADKSTITLDDQSNLVNITIRATGIADTDTIHVSLDNASPVTIAHSGNTATTSIAVSTQTTDHTLKASVKDSSGILLGEKSISFKTTSQSQTELEVLKTEPQNQATGIEPSAFIAWYFNKEINPDLLSVKVQETVHGKVYKPQKSGSGLTELNEIKLIGVHRDHEEVPGNLSRISDNNAIVFYPSREYAYDAKIYATLTYDGNEVYRQQFDVRALPTLVEGFVKDQFNDSAEQIKVVLEGVEETAITNNEGYFEFGFGEKPDKMIPPGKYKAIYNPGMGNFKYGTFEKWVTIEEGRLNDINSIILPFLNPAIPFSYISSGGTAHLANDKLIIDFTDAVIIFKDGKDNGNIHVQFLSLPQISSEFFSSAMGPWLYSIQPSGIEVSGDVHVEFAIPSFNGSLDYVQELPEYLIITGRDKESLKIVPAGVGKINKNTFRITSAKPIELELLDYLGYTLAPEDLQSLLKSYVDKEISLNELAGRLEARQ